jgi:hypothetical protein
MSEPETDRWRSILRARESIERAMGGDLSLLDQRLSSGCASAEEQKLAADLLTRRVKPRKKKMSTLLAEDRRQLVAEYVREHAKPGVKREAIIAEAADRFKIAISEVYRSLE